MRVGFAGTPEFAATALAAIVAAGFAVPLVLTRPDKPKGRGLRLEPSPVKAFALAHGLPLQQPATLRTVEARAPVTGVALDVLVVAAYGLILPAASWTGRGTAVSISMRRCCRAGGVPRPSSGRCSQVTGSPA